MNALTRPLPRTVESPAPRASSKDLLGLAASLKPYALLSGSETTIQWLTDLGFRVSQRHLKHWVLTHTNQLPELHLYSHLELKRFATGKAREYAKRTLKETRQ
ncbi:hypothetical protein [Marinobacter sp.]|uniref:hypothetical protein n=1 Tax=Marinobacter sp. TaxID=50741 RepID=UPI0034A5533D